MIKEIKIPTILGTFLLIFGLTGGLYLTTNPTAFGSKANASCQPQNPQVTNITNNSFDVSFLTTSACSCSLQVENLPYLDVKENSPVHYFQVTNLKASTPYQYQFICQDAVYQKSEYQITTAISPSTPSSTSTLAWGKVLVASQQPAPNSIVYLNIPGASPLSALVTSDGNWAIPHAISFNDLRTDWFNPPANTAEDLIIISADGPQTQILGSTSSNSPVPDIILGQDQLNPQDHPVDSALGDLPTSSSQPITTLELTNPKDGEVVHTSQPEFFGKAPENSILQITIESDQVINEQLAVGQDGRWSYASPTGLAPGEHTIIIKVQNPVTQIWQTITRRFVVNAQSGGDSLAFTASASATLAPTALPSPSQRPTQTISPTISQITPTHIPTVAPTVIIVQPSVTGPLEKTSNVIPTSLLFFFAAAAFVSGLLLIRKN
ncbi:MAG: Ig-like domain-containing protein [Candidatus Shapirobacteria bacterium]|jgi:hypothetical protein